MNVGSQKAVLPDAPDLQIISLDMIKRDGSLGPGRKGVFLLDKKLYCLIVFHHILESC